MNVRLSSESIRVRLAPTEAEQLMDTGKLSFDSAGGFVSVRAIMEAGARQPLEAGLCNDRLTLIINERAFAELMESERTKKSALSCVLADEAHGTISVKMEIDLFTRERA